VWGGVVVLAAGGAAAAVLVLHPFRHASPTAMSGTAATHTGAQQRVVGLAPTPTPTPTPSPSSSALGSGGFPGPSPTGATSASAAAPASASAVASPASPAAVPAQGDQAQQSSQGQAEQQQAAQVASLLAQSVQDRGAIVDAVADVNACGDPADDEQTFDEAATSRNSLASQLTAMNTSALPADMVQDLASAWQASAEADEDFYSWASDEVGDCTPDDSGDPNLQAATGPDDNATTYKQDFAAAWDPIASQYGLTQYQWNQL